MFLIDFFELAFKLYLFASKVDFYN